MAGADSEQIDTFRVRTVGLRSAELNLTDVIAGVAQQFKLDHKRAQALIKGRVVAREISAAKARALKTRLLQLGVVAKVEKSDATLPACRNTNSTDLGRFIDDISRHSTGVPRDLRYRLLSSAMLCGAIAVPALYFLLLAGIGVGMWQYAEHVSIHQSAAGVLLWLTPLLSGLLISALMIRPIFIRPSRFTRLQIEEKQAPQLYRLVRRISDATGTPAPEAIYVDCEANAYVTSAQGLKGYLQKRLELTIGMPLVYGMNTLQLSSVLAHEFGHFSQTFEMFTSGLVNRVNSWMGTCGWQKDPLEIKIEGLLESGKAAYVDFMLYGALWSVRAVSWLFRKLYHLNLRFTQSLSQQMEFNADDHAVQVVGSDVFVTLSSRIRELAHGEGQAWHANRGAYNENRLFENMPAAVAAFADNLDAETKAEIQAEIDAHTTEYWHSHPADRERINRAKAHGVVNLKHGDVPATALFEDSDKLARQVTLQTYTRDRGLTDASECVVSNQVILDIHKHQDESAQAIEAFFGEAYDGRICLFKEQPVADAKMPTAPKVLCNIANEKRARLDDLFISSLYSAGGIVFEPGTWDIDDHSVEALDAEMRSCAGDLREADGKVASIDAALQAKLAAALPGVAGPQQKRAQLLYTWLINASKLAEDANNLGRQIAILNALLQTLADHDASNLARNLDEYRSHAIEQVNRLCARLARMPNPLPKHDDSKQLASAADFLATWGAKPLRPDDQASHVLDVGTKTRNGIYFLYHRVMGELAQLCVNAEAASAPPQLRAEAS